MVIILFIKRYPAVKVKCLHHSLQNLQYSVGLVPGFRLNSIRVPPLPNRAWSDCTPHRLRYPVIFPVFLVESLFRRIRNRLYSFSFAFILHFTSILTFTINGRKGSHIKPLSMSLCLFLLTQESFFNIQSVNLFHKNKKILNFVKSFF